jgi:hypothetical protein
VFIRIKGDRYDVVGGTRLGFFCAHADPEMVLTEVAADGGFLSNKLIDHCTA